MDLQRQELKKRTIIFEKAWFMWLFLILFPPIGIAVLWRQGRFKKATRWILTGAGTVYFLLPVIVAMNSTVPLFYTHDDIVKAFNEAKGELNAPYEMENVQQDDNSLSFNLTEDIAMIENLDENEQVHEIIMVGQGEGTDILLSMGMLIQMTNPDFTQEDRATTLNELKITDNNFNYAEEEVTVEKNQVRYNLKFSEVYGVLFTASKVN